MQMSWLVRTGRDHSDEVRLVGQLQCECYNRQSPEKLRKQSADWSCVYCYDFPWDWDGELSIPTAFHLPKSVSASLLAAAKCHSWGMLGTWRVIIAVSESWCVMKTLALTVCPVMARLIKALTSSCVWCFERVPMTWHIYRFYHKQEFKLGMAVGMGISSKLPLLDQEISLHSKKKKYFRAPLLVLQLVTNRGP